MLLRQINLTYCHIMSNLMKVEKMFSVYIKNNDGSFPAKEADLITNNLLKIVDKKYHVLCNPNADASEEYWDMCRIFNELDILYGVKAENLEISNNELREKFTKKPILLINGPYSVLFGRTYKSISIELYKLMNTNQKSPEV